ncbi:Set3 complex subunit Snt1 [Schizosaccharomyces japonicus yFS275]|uniref:Set3 complex subunit Snt1 n=1 Tax=Schizosaccharomyces japonicus (strain yFS275 / FY16936) TaxID=402676 RepID=B6K6Q1_SCHJY|nr:Set3 complex subunit Snt1 [Schizosaccharomyces japonicus yFS275]EEB09205.1 Set3 complex subunit Snt1 [Schizosaccharomyces japonicus yFS275]
MSGENERIRELPTLPLEDPAIVKLEQLPDAKDNPKSVISEDETDIEVSRSPSPADSDRMTVEMDEDVKELQPTLSDTVSRGLSARATSVPTTFDHLDFYSANQLSFAKNAKRFGAVLRRRQQQLMDKTRQLSYVQNGLRHTWDSNNELLEKLAESEHAKEHKKSDDPLANRSTRKVFNNFSAGDIVRSEAEFMEILASLEQKERQLSSAKEHPGTAQIPDMDLDWSNRPFQAFLDENRRLRTWFAYQQLSNPESIWTPEQHELYCQSFAKHGKSFGDIANDVPGKTFQECVLHYYRTKRQINYREINPNSRTSGRRRKKSALSSRKGKQKTKGSSLMVDIEEAEHATAETRRLHTKKKRANASPSLSRAEHISEPDITSSTPEPYSEPTQPYTPLKRTSVASSPRTRSRRKGSQVAVKTAGLSPAAVPSGIHENESPILPQQSTPTSALPPTPSRSAMESSSLFPNRLQEEDAAQALADLSSYNVNNASVLNETETTLAHSLAHRASVPLIDSTIHEGATELHLLSRGRVSVATTMPSREMHGHMLPPYPFPPSTMYSTCASLQTLANVVTGHDGELEDRLEGDNHRS